MAVTAILLAAGYAVRLYPLTKDRPKALLPLGDGVILDHVVRSLDTVPGLAQCLLVTNHRFADQFRAWQRSRGGGAFQIVDDGTDSLETRLGAIRDLELARREGGVVGDLLVVGTDNLFSWPLGDFVVAAQRHLPHPSVALWEAPSAASATQFGVVERDAASRIVTFVEKSPTPPSRDVAVCVYYFPEPMTGGFRQFLDDGGNADASGYFIQWLAQRGPVYGIPMPGPWYDIGTLDAYHAAINELGRTP